MRVLMAGWLIATALSGAACHTMKPVTLETLDGVRPARVWVTRADQSVVVVEGPRVVNDRLVGFVLGRYQVMPAADVLQMRMRTPAGGRTAALVVAGALGVAAMATLMSGGEAYTNPCSLGSSECDPTAP